MASYNNFTQKNKKGVNNRHDIYDSLDTTPIQPTDNSNIIKRNIGKWAEFCAFVR